MDFCWERLEQRKKSPSRNKSSIERLLQEPDADHQSKELPQAQRQKAT
jgi:hypothetical protein